MRVRILGQYIPASLAVLAVIEALLCFFALYAAVLIRFQVGVSGLLERVEEFGPLWPRGIAFSAIVVTCLLAFGLYNSRQRIQLSGVLARLLLALAVSSCVFAALFYVFPSRHLFRGVAALAVALAVCGVLTSRMVFARVADEQIFKRRVLVYGAGYGAVALTRRQHLPRQAGKRGFRHEARPLRLRDARADVLERDAPDEAIFVLDDEAGAQTVVQALLNCGK